MNNPELKRKNDLQIEYEKFIMRKKILDKMIIETRKKIHEYEERLYIYSKHHSRNQNVLDHENFYKSIDSKIKRRWNRKLNQQQNQSSTTVVVAAKK